jgi:hypothetical protein
VSDREAKLAKNESEGRIVLVHSVVYVRV